MESTKATIEASQAVEELYQRLAGMRRTALAMRDLAIAWSNDGESRLRTIDDLYFNAVMLNRFPNE